MDASHPPQTDKAAKAAAMVASAMQALSGPMEAAEAAVQGLSYVMERMHWRSGISLS